ncbi:MAG TPA: 3'(2'),5'-bisphosphate nucleotidase CysQ [Gammaproteobacteria bacterium]|nr:3'(2'),5'-bisphosphate nucleotidase CysQ [Gammaproteobacteria bacterium]
MTDLGEKRRLLDAVAGLAREAGKAILEVYGGEFAVTFKADRSPLTEADERAHAIIDRGLKALAPDVPVLSEEMDPKLRAERRSWRKFWLVDPLDGTKEFLKRNGEFTVNIALVEGHLSVLGVVLAPALDRLYFGALGLGAWRQDGDSLPEPIHAQRKAQNPPRVVGSRSHETGALADYLAALGPHTVTPMGSSLKICLIAEGAADLYPRLGPTSEWDTAAAQAILESAGGRMIDPAGQPLRYNSKDDLLNPHFLAFGDQWQDWLAPIRSSRGRQSRN